MADDKPTIHEDIEALFARIAALQLEEPHGIHRAENVMGSIEHYITMARHQRTVIEVEREHGER